LFGVGNVANLVERRDVAGNQLSGPRLAGEAALAALGLGSFAVPIGKGITPLLTGASRQGAAGAVRSGVVGHVDDVVAPSNVAIEQGRDALGRFLPKTPGQLRPGSLAEQATFDAIKQKPGWQVIDRAVSVRDAGCHCLLVKQCSSWPCGEHKTNSQSMNRGATHWSP
jgi:hypothetical protein